MRMCRRRRTSVRYDPLLQAIWTAMFEGGCALGECRCRAAQRATGHSSLLEAGAQVLHDAKEVRGKRNPKR
jgi:hypothetical protein